MLIFNYDMNTPGKNYQGLYDFLNKLDSIRAMDSVWLIKTSNSAETFYDQVNKYFDKNDYLLVSKFNESDHYGWLPQKVCDWIEAKKRQYIYS